MNKKIFVVFGVMCVLLTLGACATQQVVFDENLPKEQSSRLVFYVGLQITAYNGIPVPFKKVMGVTQSTWHDVILPPGEMEFVLDVNYNSGNFRYTADDVGFRYKFEAGVEYTLTFTAWEGVNNTWGVKIYKQPPPSIGWPKEENLIAFVPFYKIGE
jgi:hypothetical protein